MPSHSAPTSRRPSVDYPGRSQSVAPRVRAKPEKPRGGFFSCFCCGASDSYGDFDAAAAANGKIPGLKPRPASATKAQSLAVPSGPGFVRLTGSSGVGASMSMEPSFAGGGGSKAFQTGGGTPATAAEVAAAARPVHPLLSPQPQYFGAGTGGVDEDVNALSTTGMEGRSMGRRRSSFVEFVDHSDMMLHPGKARRRPNGSILVKSTGSPSMSPGVSPLRPGAVSPGMHRSGSFVDGPGARRGSAADLRRRGSGAASEAASPRERDNTATGGEFSQSGRAASPEAPEGRRRSSVRSGSGQTPRPAW